jgi:hypothetical protein
MPLFRDEAVSQTPKCFISLNRDERSNKENIRVSSNHISLLDNDGESMMVIT